MNKLAFQDVMNAIARLDYLHEDYPEFLAVSSGMKDEVLILIKDRRGVFFEGGYKSAIEFVQNYGGKTP